VPSPSHGSITLNRLAHHLVLPKSTASVLVKDLERRGFIVRSRDPRNERQLAIVLTAAGEARVAADTVLDLHRLAAALAARADERRALLKGFEHLVDASEHTLRRQWQP